MNATAKLNALASAPALLDPFEEQAAIRLSDARKFTRDWANGPSRDLWLPLFRRYATDRKAYRIFLPVTAKPVVKKARKIAPPADVVAALRAKGYAVEDYIVGIAVNEQQRRRMKIGKLLADNPEALKSFANDPRRKAAVNADKGEGMLAVISRHPVDVAGMSTGRGWTSCMNLDDGCNKRYVSQDVKAGTLVAYLIKADDRNIQHPIGRVLIKPLAGPKKQVLLAREDTTYGTANPNFLHTVDAWLADVNKDVGSGTFKLPSSLYSDSNLDVIERWRIQDVKTPKDAAQFLLSSHSDAPEELKKAVDLLNTSPKLAREFVLSTRNQTPMLWSSLYEMRAYGYTDAASLFPGVRDGALREAEELKSGKMSAVERVNRVTEVIEVMRALRMSVPEFLYEVVPGPHVLTRLVDLFNSDGGKRGFAKADGYVKEMARYSEAVLKRVLPSSGAAVDFLYAALDYTTALKTRWPALEELLGRVPDDYLPVDALLSYAVKIARQPIPAADRAAKDVPHSYGELDSELADYLSLCSKAKRAILLRAMGARCIVTHMLCNMTPADFQRNSEAVIDAIATLAKLPASTVSYAFDMAPSTIEFPTKYAELAAEAFCRDGLWHVAQQYMGQGSGPHGIDLMVRYPKLLWEAVNNGEVDEWVSSLMQRRGKEMWPRAIAELADHQVLFLLQCFEDREGRPILRVREQLCDAAVKAKLPASFFLKLAKQTEEELPKSADAYLKRANVRTYAAYRRFMLDVHGG